MRGRNLRRTLVAAGLVAASAVLVLILALGGLLAFIVASAGVSSSWNASVADLSAALTESFCRVDVADTGPGVPEEEQARIFGRFYRGMQVREQEGLGIGLYLAREIAQKQGGYLKLSSRPGQGSTFSLYLPRG